MIKEIFQPVNFAIRTIGGEKAGRSLLVLLLKSRGQTNVNWKSFTDFLNQALKGK